MGVMGLNVILAGLGMVLFTSLFPPTPDFSFFSLSPFGFTEASLPTC